MAYGIEGSLIRLAPIDPDRHLDNCVRWMNDPLVTATLAFGAFPMTELMERDFFERHGSGSKTDIVWAIETLEGRHVGMCGLHNLDWVNRSALTGSMVGDRASQGKGYGTEAAKLRARHAFLALDLRVLYSEFLDGNEASRKMQERAGYRSWGVKPKAYYKNGRWLDAHQTVLLREEWEALRSLP